MIISQTKVPESQPRVGFKILGAGLSILLTLAPIAQSQPAAFNPSKVVIIKADDFKGSATGWTNFLNASRDLGIKVGLGVIAEGIADNAATASYMQNQQAMGDVEFWNHGWDHSRFPATGTTTSWEFKYSGLAFQQTHFSDTQAALLSATGRDAIAFGTPYNQYDADTVAIMNGTPALRMFFTHNVAAARTAGLIERVATVGIISESGGTGNPVAASFISAHPNGPAGPVSLQFHPLGFNAQDMLEYRDIVTFLLGKGYQFMLPAEYIAAIDGTTVNDPPTGITAWRDFHFKTTQNSGSAADAEDPDGDGLTNEREYILGSNPTQPDGGAPLVAASAEGDFTLSFVAKQASGAGYVGLTRRYTVESTTDLASPLQWQDLTSYADIVGENQTVTLSPPHGGDRCYYRLRITLE